MSPEVSVTGMVTLVLLNLMRMAGMGLFVAIWYAADIGRRGARDIGLACVLLAVVQIGVLALIFSGVVSPYATMKFLNTKLASLLATPGVAFANLESTLLVGLRDLWSLFALAAAGLLGVQALRGQLAGSAVGGWPLLAVVLPGLVLADLPGAITLSLGLTRSPMVACVAIALAVLLLFPVTLLLRRVLSRRLGQPVAGFALCLYTVYLAVQWLG